MSLIRISELHELLCCLMWFFWYLVVGLLLALMLKLHLDYAFLQHNYINMVKRH